MLVSDHDGALEEIAGITLTELGAWRPRVAGNDMAAAAASRRRAVRTSHQDRQPMQRSRR